jgi:hypothetical protein
MTASTAAGRALRSPATGLLLLLLVQGFFLHYWPTFHPANESIRFYFVESVVHDGTLSVDPALARYGIPNIDAARVGGKSYMDKAPGLAFAAIPPYALLEALGATEALHWTALWALLTLLTVTLPSLWATALLYRLLRDLSGRHDVALGLAAAWALATPALVYSTLFFGHQLSAALLLAAFATLKPGEQAPVSARRAAAAAFLLGWSVLTQYEVVLAASGVAAFGLLRAGTTRRRLWLVAGGAVPAALMLVYHTAAFGGPFSFPYAFKAHASFAAVHGQGVFGFGLPSLSNAAELLVGARRGLLYAAPFLALWPLGVLRMFDAPSWRHARWAVLWVGVTHTLLVLGYGYWTGGDAVGPRFLVPALPFLVLPLAALWRPAGPRWQFPLGVLRGGVLPGLVAVGVLHAVLPVATFPYHPEALEAPLFDLNVPLAVSGCTAPTVVGLEGNAALTVFLLLLAVAGAWLWYAGRAGGAPRPAHVGHARLGHALTGVVAAVAVLAAQVMTAPPPERDGAVRIRANVKLLVDCGTVQRVREADDPPFQGGDQPEENGVGSWRSGADPDHWELRREPGRPRPGAPNRTSGPAPPSGVDSAAPRR